MRDEPTGRVPNFAATPAGAAVGASGDLLMKFMMLSMATQMLTGLFGEMAGGANNFTEGMSKAVNAMMMLAMIQMGGMNYIFRENIHYLTMK